MFKRQKKHDPVGYKRDLRYHALLLEGNQTTAMTPPAIRLQSAAAVMALRSAEQQSESIKRATWALVASTVGLVIATVVLVVVTVKNG